MAETPAQPGPARASVEELLAAEARLDRSFAAGVVVLLCGLAFPVYLRITGQDNAPWAGPVAIALSIVLFLVYVWFALAVREAARRLGQGGGILFLVWILASPLLSLCCGVVPIPFLGQAVSASPMVIKFLLASQLRTAIHRRTFEED
jgi:hypothetical protein